MNNKEALIIAKLFKAVLKEELRRFKVEILNEISKESKKSLLKSVFDEKEQGEGFLNGEVKNNNFTFSESKRIPKALREVLSKTEPLEEEYTKKSNNLITDNIHDGAYLNINDPNAKKIIDKINNTDYRKVLQNISKNKAPQTFVEDYDKIDRIKKSIEESKKNNILKKEENKINEAKGSINMLKMSENMDWGEFDEGLVNNPDYNNFFD